MGEIVYFLCAATSLLCTVLLSIRYHKSRVNLLFWCAAGFFAFTVTNILLFIDLAVVIDRDLSIWRNIVTLLGVSVMVYGLITEAAK
jgi:hypothetical protein